MGLRQGGGGGEIGFDAVACSAEEVRAPHIQQVLLQLYYARHSRCQTTTVLGLAVCACVCQGNATRAGCVQPKLVLRLHDTDCCHSSWYIKHGD